MMITREMVDGVLEILLDGTRVLCIREQMKDDIFYMEAEGEIRNEVAHEFEDELMAAVSVCRKIRLDLSKITYLASGALRSLLSVQQIIDEQEGAEMILVHVSEPVMEALKESGFDEILFIEED
ncbi:MULTISPECIES: STAS domain-containing protein [unclassified Candidatus Paralachnospira]|uniref:STAS domain-containing protein n=1 Tax=unclassified Candidatus Paralachnospira TaxID=3099471 RepID=UPI003F8FA031